MRVVLGHLTDPQFSDNLFPDFHVRFYVLRIQGVERKTCHTVTTVVTVETISIDDFLRGWEKRCSNEIRGPLAEQQPHGA
jgi:hypothetical protein